MSASPELVEAVRVALGELYPAKVLTRIHAGTQGTNSITFPRDLLELRVISRAIRLAVMHTSGPDKGTLCDTHAVTDRPDIWECCAKVPVRDALMGRTCGAP